jgi:hypothetical protein
MQFNSRGRATVSPLETGSRHRDDRHCNLGSTRWSVETFSPTDKGVLAVVALSAGTSAFLVLKHCPVRAFRPARQSQLSSNVSGVVGAAVRACLPLASLRHSGRREGQSRHTETAYRMKLNAQQRTERLHLYGLVQSLSYVVRLNDLKTAQHFRARLAWVLRIAPPRPPPIVQAGVGSPPSVLRVRADCGGRLFTANALHAQMTPGLSSMGVGSN